MRVDKYLDLLGKVFIVLQVHLARLDCDLIGIQFLHVRMNDGILRLTVL